MKVSIRGVAAIKNLLRDLADERCGAAMVEFALAVPLFSVLFIGVVQGGLLLFDEIELANAANVGSRAFAVSRLATCGTCTATPYTATVNAIVNSGSLQLAASNVTLSVGGASCSSDSTCLTALNNGFNAVQGSYYSPAATTTVAVNYPCPQFLPLSWMPLTDVCKTDKYSTAGNLTVTMSQQVQ